MSEERNKLFSEPIASSGDRFDQGYDIDNNGVDFNPDDESLYPDNYEESPKVEKTKEIKTKSLDEADRYDTGDDIFQKEDTRDLSDSQSTGDIFQTEPVNNFQEAPIKHQTNNYNFNKTPSNDEYEDEPETSNTKWWVIGGIILIILICLGWFVFGRGITHETNQPNETQTEEKQEEAEQEEKPEEETTENTENYYDDTYEEPNTYVPPSNQGSSSGSNSSGNSGYSNNNSGNNNNNGSSSIGTDTAPDSSSSDSTDSTDQAPADTDSGGDSTVDNSTSNNTSNDHYQLEPNSTSSSDSASSSDDAQTSE